MKTNDIRKLFLDYFCGLDHTKVPSSSLVPADDPTLLFTNAGMVQFKDIFLGRKMSPYQRVTTVQKCMRAGGKHNDLENVGYTERHHTFFEMLGNFSFGDYFKKEAIRFAWEFLTKRLAIPSGKLWVTVYEEDKEAYKIWSEDIRIDTKRLVCCGKKDNFWAMGETGPCGPCSEIYYDHGEDVPGEAPRDGADCGDRYVEIWNLVFMQYCAFADGTLKPLPKPSVDTGMGLERIAAVMQGVTSNYDIDLFKNILQDVSEITEEDNLKNPSLRVIADHIRAITFLILDGVIPSNEGRGYVLRRIMRRAARHGYNLGTRSAFLYRLVSSVVREMHDAYPELSSNQDRIMQIVRIEEEQFLKTLGQGLRIFEEVFSKVRDFGTIPGDAAFKLYDTYGFPLDLTASLARDRGFIVDEAGFEKAMQQQREKSKAASKFAAQYEVISALSKFEGYKNTVSANAKVISLLRDGKEISELKEKEEGVVVLDRTPFYAFSGGQACDQGELKSNSCLFIVNDVQKSCGAILHSGKVKNGSIRVGDELEAVINIKRRQALARSHSATHLLQEALRHHLGSKVEQKGSSVDVDRLRFDFSYFKAIDAANLKMIEDEVNEKILLNLPVCTDEMSLEDAKKSGAIALFGEKYEDLVRVVRMGDYSKELCGGTHVMCSSEIGIFKIISESAIASGVRRIEALVGEKAREYFLQEEELLSDVTKVLKTNRERLIEQTRQAVEKNAKLEKQLELYEKQEALRRADDLLKSIEHFASVDLLCASLGSVNPKILRFMVDYLKEKLNNTIIVLASTENNPPSIYMIVGVTNDCCKHFSARELLQSASTLLGGKGGGRPDLAQGGGTKPANLPKIFELIRENIKKTQKE